MNFNYQLMQIFEVIVIAVIQIFNGFFYDIAEIRSAAVVGAVRMDMLKGELLDIMPFYTDLQWLFLRYR